jgi:hypothetical protein
MEKESNMEIRFGGVGLALCICAACGGGVRDPEPSKGSAFEQFCEASSTAAAEECSSTFDVEHCKESEACDSMLLHHPGGEVFNCLAESPCGPCLDSVYVGADLTQAGKAFAEQCGKKNNEGCPLFEDLCFAGALFNDDALATMTACLDLATCGEVQACIDASYTRCVGWAYPNL